MKKGREDVAVEVEHWNTPDLKGKKSKVVGSVREPPNVT
jgi:hypothetical protein